MRSSPNLRSLFTALVSQNYRNGCRTLVFCGRPSVQLNSLGTLSTANSELTARWCSRPFSSSSILHCTSSSGSSKSTSSNPSEALPPRKREPRFNFRWRNAFISLAIGGIFTYYMLHLRQLKQDEVERKRRRAIGKSKIGGPWQLVSADTGKLESNENFKGKWTLIYFGFTHCPDICPDEMEKMCAVADILKKDAENDPIQPIFFTIDPARDTCDAVKKYCADFSPALRGFTGSEEQVEKVCRTFRVYRSQGPKDEADDYIVDHTVIIYLMDPKGVFTEYYGQNRNAQEIADAISLQMFKYKRGQSHGWW